MLGFNPVYLLVPVPIALAWLARMAIQQAYRKYERLPNRWGIG